MGLNILIFRVIIQIIKIIYFFLIKINIYILLSIIEKKKYNGFAQWIEENTCVFCVTVILLFFALFILISLIIVRFACGNKKKKVVSRSQPHLIHFDEDNLILDY